MEPDRGQVDGETREPTLQQLRCFQVLSQELHYGRAAQRLRISQPPLSRHIQALERALGLTLFVRSSRRVELTPAGAALAADIGGVLKRLDVSLANARDVAHGLVGSLAIGYVEPLGIDFLPRVLGRFRDLHPRHNVRLHEMHTRTQIDALLDGTIDCALLRSSANVEPSLSFETVARDRLVVAIPERSRLADDPNPLALADLADQPFVVYDTSLGMGILTATLTAAARAGFSPAIAHSAHSTPMLLALVAAGEGVALVSGELAKVRRPGIRFRDILDRDVYSDVLVGWRTPDRSPVLADLRAVIRRVATNDAVSGIDTP